MTELRKLATITVMATDKLKLATMPAMSTAAPWRWRRARSTASKMLAWRKRLRCGHTPNSAATTAGTRARPPSSRQATAA